jgi:hypothetical protein
MTAPRYALLTESMARKMKVGALEKIIEEAIGLDLAPSQYRNRNTDERIKSLYLAKDAYWRRMQSAQPIAEAARPDILPAAEVNAWLRSLPAQVQP